MPTTRCLICSNPAIKDFVDGGLNKGLTNRAVAAGLTAVGGKTFDPDVVGRHKANHWTKPVDPDAPKPTKRDLAILLRDKVADAIVALPENREPEYDDDGKLVTPGSLPILDDGVVKAAAMGLKAQAILDKREQNQQKLGLAAGYLGLQLLLRGLGEEQPEPVMIEDGLTIEGEYTDETD